MKIPSFATHSPLPRVCLLAAGLAMPSQAAVLAAWDTWSDTTTPHDANTLASGFTATVTISNNQNRYNSTLGSTDGTYGDNLTGASTAMGSILMRARDSANTATIVLTNNTGESYNLTSLHFDYEVRTASGNWSFRDFTVTYTTGGLGPANTQIAGWSTTTAGSYDFDYTLSNSLTDILLADGQSASFVIAFSNNLNSLDVSGPLDNVAIQGTLVPEPRAALLGGLGLLALLRRRRS